MRKKKDQITAEAAVIKAKRNIAVVIIAGLVLIVADYMISYDKGIAVENSYGQLYLIRPEAGSDNGYLSLTAEIEGKDGIYEKKVSVMLEPYESQMTRGEAEQKTDSEPLMDEEERIEYDLRLIADTLNSDNSVKKVGLPVELDTGEKISWQVEDAPKTNTLMIIIMMVAASVLIYRERFSPLKRDEANNRDSVSRQLPGFINRLVLLINAGMVLNSAFEKAVEESTNNAELVGDYFYTNIRGIYVSMKTANGSMNNGLKDFARRSGVQELMRISNIIDDNVSKGTELTMKLRGESELLWMARKKKCEELGRLAETKLTLPLMFFLIVLIVITISPALLGL